MHNAMTEKNDQLALTNTDTTKLKDCGKNFGKDINFSNSNITTHLGNDDWYETSVKGVVGMHGYETGEGPAILMKDTKKSAVDFVWTDGLTGCMSLAMVGTDKDGKNDAFFCHARQYDKMDAIKNDKNPMKHARDFVQSHDNLRVFWGTDFYAAANQQEALLARQKAQQYLSNQLGCWVRDSDCIVASEVTFLPKHGIAFDGKPAEVYQRIQTMKDLPMQIEFSNSKALQRFTPDPTILQKINIHLDQVKQDKTGLRFFHLDDRRKNKISVLEGTYKAYEVGNFDILRHFAGSAEKSTSPTINPSGKNVWSSRVGGTKSLVIEAYDDALNKIRNMNDTGCGLREDGQNIFNAQEYQERNLSRSEKLKME